MIRLQHERLTQSRPRSGDPCGCPKCKGRLRVVDSKVNHDAGLRVQYLACNVCHERPDDNKVVKLLADAPLRTLSY